MTRISGFADEISDDLETQLTVLNGLGVRYLCLRSAGGRSIADYSLDEAKTVLRPALVRHKIGVSSIGSPVGKVFLGDEDAFGAQLRKLDTLCGIAKLLCCRYIRVFSFYIPDGVDPDGCDAAVFEKMEKIVGVCAQYGVTPIHENEKGIFGDTGARCRRLHDAFRGTALRAAFDFANFVQCGEDPLACYRLLRDYVAYVHIKDADASTHTNVLFGTGDGRVREILRELKAAGYDGFLTLEPHLSVFGSLHSLELGDPESEIRKNAYPDGKAAFTAQYHALTALLSGL